MNFLASVAFEHLFQLNYSWKPWTEAISLQCWCLNRSQPVPRVGTFREMPTHLSILDIDYRIRLLTSEYTHFPLGFWREFFGFWREPKIHRMCVYVHLIWRKVLCCEHIKVEWFLSLGWYDRMCCLNSLYPLVAFFFFSPSSPFLKILFL